MKNLLFLSLILLCLQSCISLVGLTNGYNSLSNNEKQRCAIYDTQNTTINSNSNNVMVYGISGTNLRELLYKSANKYQIVYSFHPDCPSDACISISSFLERAKTHNVEAFIVSRYYAPILFEQSESTYPIFVMDAQSYQTKYVFKYAPKFIFDITEGAITGEEKEAYNMYLFEGGKFVKAFDGLAYVEILKGLPLRE